MANGNNKQTLQIGGGGGGSGTVTSVSSTSGDLTITNPTTTPALTVVSAPKLTTARTINGVSFDGTANITVADSTKVPTTTTISTTAPLSGGGDLSANRTLTTSMDTNKLIGRGTAGTGVMEEITLGTNLSFTGTTLNAAGGSFSLTEDELDFGSGIPVRTKRFTITNGSISGTSKIIVSSSGSIATGRVGNDWEWDSINFTAKAGTGNFVVTANATGRIRGKRKIFYSFS